MSNLLPDIKKIQLLVLDVDGTMTDGGIYYDDEGRETKKFNAKDGLGIVLAQKAGIHVMILTGRTSSIVEHRGTELKVKYIFQGVRDKASFLQLFWHENNISAECTAFIGDDLNDLDAMKLVAHTACPSDAVEEIREISDLLLTRNGGCGAVREYIDFLLKSRGVMYNSAETIKQ